MNQSLIWGTILVLMGLSLILKSLFHITIPLLRPFFGCVLIYLGLSVMMDPFNESPDKKTVIFGKSTVQVAEAIKTYNITFASGVIDISALPVAEPKVVTVNTVFGSGELILNPAVPTKIIVNALCARAALPDETLVSFGRNTYKTVDDKEPLLTIHLNVVFGNIDVTEHSVRRLSQSVEKIDLADNVIEQINS